MSKLVNFLTQLAIDPQQQILFESDPNAIIEKAGLTEVEKQAVLKGVREDISDLVAGDLPLTHRHAVAGNCFMADPGPDPDTDPDPWPDE